MSKTRVFGGKDDKQFWSDKPIREGHPKFKAVLPAGLPTHSVDITGKCICLGDKVTYDFDDNTSSFVVVFENNAFRKKYPKWPKDLEKPILEYGSMAEKMRLKVVHSAKKDETRNYIVSRIAQVTGNN